MSDGLLALGDIVKTLSVDRLARMLLGLSRRAALDEIVLTSDMLLSVRNSGDGVAVKLAGMFGLYM